MQHPRRSVVRSWFEDFANGRDLDMASELMTSDHVYHDPHVPADPGPDGTVETIRPYQEELDGRLRNGKIAEHWTVWDTLTMLQQLGVVPAQKQS